MGDTTNCKENSYSLELDERKLRVLRIIYIFSRTLVFFLCMIKANFFGTVDLEIYSFSYELRVVFFLLGN